MDGMIERAPKSQPAADDMATLEQWFANAANLAALLADFQAGDREQRLAFTTWLLRSGLRDRVRILSTITASNDDAIQSMAQAELCAIHRANLVRRMVSTDRLERLHSLLSYEGAA